MKIGVERVNQEFLMVGCHKAEVNLAILSFVDITGFKIVVCLSSYNILYVIICIIYNILCTL